MKTIQCTLLFVALIASIEAKTFTVGKKTLEVPSPDSFALVTPQMDTVYRLSLQMADPMNDLLAYYIPESEVPTAMSGGIPSSWQNYSLKVNKEIKNLVVGSKEFANIKNAIAQQNQKILESIKAKMPELMGKTSKGVSEEFDVDFAMNLSQMVPLEPHHETDNSFAYSMYLNYSASAEGHEEDFIVAGTVTFLNVSGKILYLYCYGAQEELEWTRNASKSWEEKILKSNTRPPEKSPAGRGVDWSRVVEKGIIGAILGGLIALMFSIFSRFKKKD